MKYSTHYGLYLPEGTDFISPEQYNQNFETLEGKLKALDGHRHGIGDLTGVAAASHTHAAADLLSLPGHGHSAGEITSGVFAEARIPLLTEPTRLVGTVTAMEVTGEITAKTNATRTVICPFNAARATIPRRVMLIVTGGSTGDAVSASVNTSSVREGRSCVVDMMRVGNTVDAFVETTAVIKAAGAEARYEAVRRYLRNVHAEISVISYNGTSTTTAGTVPKADVISAFGGCAFFAGRTAGSANSAGTYILRASVGLFSYDQSQVTLTISGSSQTTGDQDYEFVVYGYIFD